MVHQKYLPIGLLMSSFACISESKIISANQDRLDARGEVYYFGDFQRETQEKNEKSLDTAPKLVPECPLPCFKDNDKDNYGNPQVWICESLFGFVKDSSDCDDNNFYIHPKAKETCNGLDDNCDGVIDNIPDEDLTVYYQDEDGDGFGDPNDSGKYCSVPEGFVDNSSDCDDSNNKVNPKAVEICNGVDDNCQNGIDENLTQLCSRACGSGTEYCVNGTWQNCNAPPLQPEVCDGLDNNCNGEIDEGLTLEQKCGETDAGACSFGIEYSYCNGKKYTEWMNCTAVFPAVEMCDGEDNDCNGETDEDGVCIFCEEYANYTLTDGKCCTKGEQGGLMCLVDFFYSSVHQLRGLTWDGQHLWVASSDYSTLKIYKLTTTGEIIDSFDSPGSYYPQGLAWDGQHLRNANDYTDKIYQLTTTGAIVGSFYSFGEYPTGLAWDGEFLWNADGGDGGYDKIYKLTTTGEVLASWDSPGDYPTGLAWDGQHLWLASNGYFNNKIYQLTTTGETVNSFYAPNEEPQGLAWDSQYLWHADSTNGEDKIYQLEVIKE